MKIISFDRDISDEIKRHSHFISRRDLEGAKKDPQRKSKEAQGQDRKKKKRKPCREEKGNKSFISLLKTFY